MFAKSILLVSFAFAALADLIPAPQVTSISSGNLDSLLDAASSLVGTDYSSLLGDVTSVLGALSGIPTLPISVLNILATAIPESELTRSDFQCIATATPSWYSDLPSNAKDAISSYETALSSWYTENSANLPIGTDLLAPCMAATAASGSPTTTASSNIASIASSSLRTGSASLSSTSAGSAGAVTTTGSLTAAAPRATAIAASIAGLAGILGVMVAL